MRRKQIVYGLLILMLFSSSCGAVSHAPEKSSFQPEVSANTEGPGEPSEKDYLTNPLFETEEYLADYDHDNRFSGMFGKIAETGKTFTTCQSCVRRREWFSG